MLLRLLNRRLHPGIIRVPLRVDEEIIFPIHLSARTLLDVRQVDAVLFENIQHLGQCAGLVSRREHDRRLVFAGAAQPRGR